MTTKLKQKKLGALASDWHVSLVMKQMSCFTHSDWWQKKNYALSMFVSQKLILSRPLFPLGVMAILLVVSFTKLIIVRTADYINSIFFSWLKKIIWVIGVQRRTVVTDWCFDNLCGSHLQSQVVVLGLLRTSVLLKTPTTQMIFFNQGILLLGSNHFLIFLSVYLSLGSSRPNDGWIQQTNRSGIW